MRRFWWIVPFGLALSFPAWGAEDEEHEARGAAHAAEHHGAAHSGHGAEHVPTWDGINWIYGAFGEKEGAEPSLLFRPKGMPAPFGIWILDALILYGFIFRVAKQPVKNALKNRKTTILRGMDEAARMKREAEARLGEYEEKLRLIDEDVKRVQSEMRESAETERVRILEEARARRKRQEDDARLLVQQELSAATQTLRAQMIAAAMRSAAASAQERVRPEDQQRLADEYLAGLSRKAGVLRGSA